MTTDSLPRTLPPASELVKCKPGFALEGFERTPQVRCHYSLSSVLPPTPFLPRSVFDFFFKRTETNVRDSDTVIPSKRFRELNMKYSSTRNIPNELLLQIFQFFCSPSEFGYVCPQFILGAVSSLWRGLVMNAPELWETFSIKVTNGNLRTIDPLLCMYCCKQGSFPRSIQLDFEALDYFGSDPDGNILKSLPPLENAIFASEGTTKITAMKLHCPPIHWITTNVTSCSNLYELSLSYTSQNIGTFSWSAHFQLPPLPSLRVLRLDNVPITLSLELLQASTNLIGFHCAPLVRSTKNDLFGWSEGRLWLIDQPQRKKAFPKLEHLTWTPRENFWDNYFLQFYRFPGLRSFSWPIWLGQHSREQFDTFLSALPRDLETFEMVCIPSSLMPWCRYQKILEKIPAIKRLVFRDFPPSSHARLLGILQVPTLLPSLTAVTFIQRLEEEVDDGNELACRLYTMLEQRKMRGAKVFRFETVNVKMHWGVETRTMIAGLMDGVEFKVDVLCNDAIIL